eukprot:TRINITY_DN181_c0_g2_i1.p1 TRINITY_DN181_c0_g2~~TRINITY_DN181_c0_g2_i1.p1  ORF type:complete len:491 (+),score=154.78 TRINITY_DN181_c0_g2_i1:56-1528(+)
MGTATEQPPVTGTELLPQERHKKIAGLNAVASTMKEGDKQLLQKLIQAAVAENELRDQVALEGVENVATMMASCIAVTHQLDNVGALLELLVMLLKSVEEVGSAIAARANDTEDAGLHLEKWCNDDSGRVVAKAMEAFALILVASDEKYCDKWMRQLLKSIHTKLKEAKNASEENCQDKIATTEAAVKALAIICGPVHLRPVIAKPAGGDISAPALLPALLFPGENSFATAVEDHPQFVYDATRALWQLSFSPEVLLTIDGECRPRESIGSQPIITVLNNLLVKQKKEKCVRMTLMILMNYVKAHEDQRARGNAGIGPNYIKDMIGVGMIQHLEMLQKRTFGDVDILPDVKELLELLETNVDDLSSYTIYKQELASGVLEWSPPHTSEKFWKETVRQFENDGYAPIKELGRIITTSKKALNVQIACHDIGEFVRHHPQGKRQWELLEIKARVYELIEQGMGSNATEQENTKKHALLCMQKIMVRRWEYLD